MLPMELNWIEWEARLMIQASNVWVSNIIRINLFSVLQNLIFIFKFWTNIINWVDHSISACICHVCRKIIYYGKLSHLSWFVGFFAVITFHWAVEHSISISGKYFEYWARLLSSIELVVWSFNTLGDFIVL